MDLIADHISHRFGTLAVLDDVSFTVCSGEVVAIVGPSGCGKSTLLSILGGLLQPSAGQAELRGAAPPARFNPLTFVFQDFALLGGLLRQSAGQAELRGAMPPASFNPLSFVFQDFSLLPWCTVEENVEF